MSAAYSIGVDLGGTNLRAASYDGGTEFLDSIETATLLAEGRERVVRDMCGAISALIQKRPVSHRLVGIAIGSPGPLELPEGILRNPPNLPGWDGFNLRHAIEQTLGRMVKIESDANLAALAEQKLGAGKTHSINSLCVLTLGTGVGNGLIINDEIWHGSTGMGGEGGHAIVQDDGGEPCGCGGFGCLEQYASASAIVRMAHERMGDAAPTTSHQVALLARAGDTDATSVFRTVGHSLAVGLTGLINTLNLPLYLLGGGVCEAWDLFSPTMFRELHERSYVYRLTEPDDIDPTEFEWHKTYLLRAQLGAIAGLLGACLLAFQNTASATDAESRPPLIAAF